MSTVPQAKQIRRTFNLSDGTIKYEVNTSIVDKGDLPIKELFVIQIVDVGAVKSDVLVKVATPHELWKSDPNNDLYVKVDSTEIITLGVDPFARIASIDDVTDIPRDRVVAVNRGLKYYLSSSVSLLYDNLTTADAAYREILARLSELVDAWRQYTSTFITMPSQLYNLPQTSISVEDERINTYKTKKEERIAAEEVRDTAKTNKDLCETEGTADKQIYTFLLENYSFLNKAKNIVNTIVETGSYNVRDFVKKQGAYSSSAESYENLLQTTANNLAIYEARVRDHDATCANLQVELLLAESAVEAARIQENNALAAVLAVCPTFDANSV